MNNFILKILSDGKSSGVGSGGNADYNLPNNDSDNVPVSNTQGSAANDAEAPLVSSAPIDGYESQVKNGVTNLVYFAAGFLCCSLIIKYVIEYSSLRKGVHKPASTHCKR